MHVVHIITSLATGGAEAMLLKLVSNASPGIRHSVISLQTMGTIGPKLVSAGANVFSLNMSGGRLPGIAGLRLVGLVKSLRPDVIQGWMYHGNLAASFAHVVLRPRTGLLWSVRCSLNVGSTEKWLTRAVVYSGALLSKRPHSIIYNSHRSKLQHEGIGYRPRRSDVVPNGFDQGIFAASLPARSAMRLRHGIPGDALVFGLLARLHPMKDHLAFLKAAGRIATESSNVFFVAAGRDVPKLATMHPDIISDAGAKLLLLPEQDAPAEFLNGLDVLVLSSAWGEGFPNVLGEAMACGTPCIATDVGDSAAIIGDTGLVVPPASCELLTDAMRKMIVAGAEGRHRLAIRARERVTSNYSIANVVKSYEGIWLQANRSFPTAIMSKG